MKVVITYWPEKEALLATLLDNVIAQTLTESFRAEDDPEDSPFRHIVFDTKKRKRRRRRRKKKSKEEP